MGTRNQTASQGEAACVTDPGYGYYAKEVRICEMGSWSAGLAREPCTACGLGRTTADDGATALEACEFASGWTDGGNGAATPCPLGRFKEQLGPQPCDACPNGTYTTFYGANLVSDCSVCMPGYGAPGGSINPLKPACAMCGYDTYSSGMGAMACTTCGAGMVSRMVRGHATRGRIALANEGARAGALLQLF
jgi:hypothetical protein